MEPYEAQDRKYIWHPFDVIELPNLPLIKRAEGAYLITDDGKRIFDGISSWWVNLHGHTHPKIVEAIQKQASQLEHVLFAGFTHIPAIQLGKMLVESFGKPMSKVFYSDNGSTAVEVAIKLAVQYWQIKEKPKTRFLAIEGAYHGDTFGAMAVGARGMFSSPFDPLLFEVDFVPFPTETNANEIVEYFQNKVLQGNYAGFIYEPLVQGSAGMRIYDANILEQFLAFCKEQDVLCIADEVMTGFGRTGRYFASDYMVTKPDLVCLSKGITGGFLPLGATLCAETIVEAFSSNDLRKIFYHGHSYTANPLACAAAVASFDLLKTNETQESIKLITELHKNFVKRIEQHSNIQHIASIGTILAITIRVKDRGYFSRIRDILYHAFLEKGLLLRPLGNVLYILPPYCTQVEELNWIYLCIEEVLNSLEHYTG